jgi:hypothetical protein
MNNNYNNDTRPIDVDTAWNNLHGRLQKENLIADSGKERRFFAFSSFKWAAAAVLALCLTTVAIKFFIPEQHKMPLLSMRNADAGNTLVKTLEDGSTVYVLAAVVRYFIRLGLQKTPAK